MSVILDNIHQWRIELKEAEATIEIVANPGEDEVQLRLAPTHTGNFPGFALLTRTNRQGIREYRKALRKLKRAVLQGDAPNGISTLEFGGANKVQLVLGEADFDEFINALGEAVRVSATDAMYLAGR